DETADAEDGTADDESFASTERAATRLGALVEVDLERSRRGLRSVLLDRLGERSVLEWTIRRVEQCATVGTLVLVAHRRFVPVIERELGALRFRGSPATWFFHDHDDIADRDRLRRARAWGKDGWRGGIGDSYFFCEAGNPHAFRDVMVREAWDEAVVVPAEAVFLEPSAVDGMVRHYCDERRGLAVYLSTAPPGIAADIVSRRLIETTSEAGASLDRVYGFRLDEPNRDADLHRIFHHFDEALTTARGRYTIDGETALHRARSWLAADSEPPRGRDAIGRRRASPLSFVGTHPEELVVELTDDRGGRRAAREGRSASDALSSLDPTAWRAILDAISANDDALLTLGGGYADPVLDPDLGSRIREARAVGAYGIHIDTVGAAIDEDRAGAIVAASPTVITVDLGAPSEEIIAELFPGTPTLATRCTGLEALLPAVASAPVEERPFVVVAVSFDERSAPHLDEFFDRWASRVDRIVIRGIEGPRGEEHPRSLGCFAPPNRTACARLATQMRVEFDGVVPLCARDPEIAHPVGDLRRQSVAEVWTGGAFTRARETHLRGEWDAWSHCGPCRSWFRFD
ncbi:MAG: SPASM domain-containing protein, partial [Planctomycetes bacterium]|nr:SPASM domain-containing protein [Planctomycetota bacterium]